MKEPLKVGDKVVVYESGARVVCSVQETYPNKTNADKTNLLKVNAGNDHNWQYRVVHVNQCRRLKKKNRRRVWIHKHANDVSCGLAANAWFNKSNLSDEYIEFVEVKK